MGDTFARYTIEDTSPTISYSPFPDTLSIPDLSAGWNPYYEPSGFAAAQGQVGNGTSYHITSKDGASLAIRWHGNGIQLFGNTTLSSYSISLDDKGIPLNNTNPSNPEGLLADIHGLQDGLHTVILTAQIPPSQIPVNSSMLVFDKAVILSSPSSVSSTLSVKPQPLDDNSVAFLGRWSFEPTQSGPSAHISRTAGDRAITNFNGTSFSLQGLTSPQGANYSVTLDNITTTLSSVSSFAVLNTTLFLVSGLNSSAEHSVEIRNEGGQLSLLENGFTAFVTYNPPPPAPPTPSPSPVPAQGASYPKGTIAALALAGILAFILLTGLLFFFLVWRPRRQRRKKLARADFESEDNGASYTGTPRRVMQERRWLGSIGRNINSSKDQEAETDRGVIDIGRGGSLSKEEMVAMEDIGTGSRGLGAVRGRDRSRSTGSGKSGFAKWRRGAMEGMGLPILFGRSSPAQDEKLSPGTEPSHLSYGDQSYGGYLPGRVHMRETSGSDESGSGTDSPTDRRNLKAIAMANLKNKGKARQITGASSSPLDGHSRPGTDGSWSPSFRLDLPIPLSAKSSRSKFRWNLPGTSKQHRGSGNISRTSSPGALHGHDQSSSGQDQLSSFMAADPSPVVTRQRGMHEVIGEHPPSYAASQHDSNASSPIPSVPRSVTHSHSNSPVNATYSRPLHQREDSRHFLLHGDGESDEDAAAPYDENHRSLPPLPPPTSSQSSTTSYPVQIIEHRPETLHVHTPLVLHIPATTGRHGHDRGSASTDSNNNQSVMGQSSLRQVIRSLSPRTSERMAGSSSGTSLGLGYLYNSGQTPDPNQGRSTAMSLSTFSERERNSPVEFARNATPSGVPLALEDGTPLPSPGGLGDATSSRNEEEPHDPLLPDVRASSPFRVDFDWRSARVPTIASNESGQETPAAYLTGLSGKSNRPSSDVPPIPTSRSKDFEQGTSKAPFRLTMSTVPYSANAPPAPPSEVSSDAVTSFLDFTSSREGSVRTKSIKTMASHEKIFGDGASSVFPSTLSKPGSKEPKSRWSNTTMPSVSTRAHKEPFGDGASSIFPSALSKAGSKEPKSRWSNTTMPSISTRAPTTAKESSGDSSSPKALSPQSEGEHSSGSNPFPFSVHVMIPPSPHHIMDFPPGTSSFEERRRSRQSIRTQQSSGDAPPHTHPAIPDLESPTDSVPRTVSDIHFRHSDLEDPSLPNSRRTTESSIAFHTQILRANRHPPLPESLDEESGSNSRPFPTLTYPPTTAQRPRSASSATSGEFPYTPLAAGFDSTTADTRNSDKPRTNI